jgi:tetrahydromethanopterin S-methyltransferase subunit D
MNWTVVPRITGGLGCMLVLILGIASGIDPLLCTIRGLIGGMVGWIGGALWAYVMSQLMPPETSTATPAADSPKPEPDEKPAESEEAA